MSLLLRKKTKDLLKKYGVLPEKRFGQNFLIKEQVVERMVKAANVRKKDVILEIGPGLGVLTSELAKKAGTVVAVEKDRNMARILKQELGFGNLEILEQDARDVKEIVLPYKVVSNLPFYLAAPIIRQFLEADNQPKKMVLLVQKEVAQRITSNPPKMNLLAASVQFYATPKILEYVSKKEFYPQPKVDSAIIEISPLKRNLPKEFSFKFFKVAKAGFSQPRKQIKNNLAKLGKEKISAWLAEANIDPRQRAETVDIDSWIKLAKTYKS